MTRLQTKALDLLRQAYPAYSWRTAADLGVSGSTLMSLVRAGKAESKADVNLGCTVYRAIQDATQHEPLKPCPLPLCGGEAIDKGHGIICVRCGLWLSNGTQTMELGGCRKVWNTRHDVHADDYEVTGSWDELGVVPPENW